jgi:hypothetical protein
VTIYVIEKTITFFSSQTLKIASVGSAVSIRHGAASWALQSLVAWHRRPIAN